MYTAMKADDLKPKNSNTAVFQGEDHGSGISFFWVNNDPGQGPDLHRHPYSETWLVVSGRATMTADGTDIEAAEGDIIVVGPNTPHKFRNTGSEMLRVMCVHASPRFIQEKLEE